MNYDKNWDVIIVGAGPGGLKCGQRFAKNGMKTLLIDRKQEIGIPKRCGEGLSSKWMEIAGEKPDPSWCRQHITGAILVTPSGKRIVIDTEKSGETGWIIERRVWEKKLAEEAIRLGAKIMLKTLVYDVIKKNDFVVGVRVDREGRMEEYYCKLLIAADGVDSMVAQYAGIKTTMPLTECDSGYQYEMVNVPLENPKRMEIYLGKEIAPRGYVWVIPKGKDIANIGVGISGNEKKTAKYYLDRWIEKNWKRFKNASIVEINAGVIPVTSPIKEMVGNGIIIIGDAARMVNPIHGGGIGESMEAGIIASEIGSEAIKKGELSKKELMKFQERYRNVRGKQMQKIFQIRKFFEKLSDEQIDILADIIEPETIVELAHGRKLSSVIKAFIKKSPAAAKFALSFLRKN